MPGCPDADAIARFVEGRLDRNAAARLEAHFDECPDCSRIVAELVRFDESAPGGVADRPDPRCSLPTSPGVDPSECQRIEPGVFVGRYQILRRVGAGGMGDVYLAYDPELDRRVAVKVLRDDGHRSGAGDSLRARLQREALALARLSHPNVIGVHDVGLFAGRVFIAMEYVDGGTLGDWLSKKRRPWSEVRPVFLAAGRGLQAAHSAGLVHRDFKPDNVLIGTDGRVWVTDFGLARSIGSQAVGDESSDESEVLPASVTLESLTATGALVGTPAYMAPEQFDRRLPEAAGDQYAFCVVLYEALAGHRPFAASSIAELAGKVTSSDPPPLPRDCKVPRGVRLALRRGLERDPAQRFETMDALLAMLERETSSRRWISAGLLGAVLIGAGAFGTTVLEPSGPALCRGAPLGSVWNAPVRERIRDVFAASELSYATQSFASVEASVDGYVRTWSQVRASACVPGSYDEGQRTLQRACLERRRDDLSIVLEVLGDGDDETIRRAASVVATLPDIEQCRDPARYEQVAGPPAPPEVADEVEALRSMVAQARALRAAGDLEGAGDLSVRALNEAQRVGHEPVVAEALLARALARGDLGELDASADDLRRALTTAIASHHRRLAAEVMVNLVFTLGHQLGDVGAAELLASQAQAELDALGGDERLRSELLLNLGSTLFTGGRWAEALDVVNEGLALRRTLGSRVRTADAIYNGAALEFALGRYHEAERHLLEAQKIYEAELGPDHPALVDVHQTYGQTLLSMHRFDEARTQIERARDLRREQMGPDHPEHVNSLGSLAAVASAQGRLDEAVALNHESVDLAMRVYGEDQDSTIRAWLELGKSYVRGGRDARGLEIFEKQERVARTHLGPEHPVTADALRLIGWARIGLDQPAAAMPILQRALAAFRSQDEHDVHAVTDTLALIANAAFDAGQYETAVSAALEAEDVSRGHAFEATYRPTLRVFSAMSRWELGEDRPAQLVVVRAELDALREEANELGFADACEQWLAERSPRRPRG